MTVRRDDDTGLDDLDPNVNLAQDATRFRRVVAAGEAVSAAERELDAAVADAREAGDSWTVISAALGVTEQLAYQRFGRR